MFKSKKLIVTFTAIFMQIALVICSPSIANDDATARAILEDIQRQIQKYKASRMSVGNRAMYVAELEIEKSTILAGFDKSKAIDNLKNTEWYIKSLRISSGNERKLLAFVRKANIVLLRGGIPNATFPGFGH
jgi:aminopeptidase-like protein